MWDGLLKRTLLQQRAIHTHATSDGEHATEKDKIIRERKSIDRRWMYDTRDASWPSR